MPSPEEAITAYILAKDGNRPHLLSRAFDPEAEVRLEVRTAAIAFPDRIRGLAAIEDALVRRFAAEFENVYTFCLARPAADARQFSCSWLVGMVAKADGMLRVGVGTYDWAFAGDGRVARLTITIETMPSLPPAPAVLDWLAALPYPWCAKKVAQATLPALPALDPIARSPHLAAKF